MEYVILVDEDDKKIGLMEKMEAHERSQLHRAFSVFVYNDKKQIMLQQRALEKYHSGGLWTNTCCSHPRDGELTIDGAHRRLMEEMGFDCELEEVFDFVYKAELDKGLTEFELDHVFIGEFNGLVELNSDEAMDYKWISYDNLTQDMIKYPEKYTEWFKIIMETLEKLNFRDKMLNS
jgi:isopentenyl-diphosphate delta-isomerase